jgi:hypothetical protein
MTVQVSAKKRVKKSSKTSAATAQTTAAPATTPSSIAATPVPVTVPTVMPISADVVSQCMALLGQVSGLLGPVTPLSASERMRSLKLRKGGAQVVTQLLALCTQHNITTVGPVTVQGMTEELDRANALNQIGVQFDAVQKKLNDAAFSAESTSWQYATALYTVLQRLAGVDPTLAAGLQPVQAFFQTRNTKGTRRATQAAAKVKAAAKLAAKMPSTPSESTAPAVAASASSASVGAAPAMSGGNAGSNTGTNAASAGRS